MRLTLLDWDKLSFNDFVGDELAVNVPKKDPNTGFYPEEEDGPRTFQQFNSRGLRRTPTITFRVRRAKYQLYDALRQRLCSNSVTQTTHVRSCASSSHRLTRLDIVYPKRSFFTRWNKSS
ncbi:hypothetical protein EDB85DRAFT_980117 [Lactarius pseudohatsudake]|nr:hypothetical protein EDB85DRAFT_980117 [Lactarius pseudohatsudake]